jgi:hypothetical protein
MTDENLSIDAVRKMAADIGMTRLTDAHLQELLRATNAARARRATLNNDTLTYADEPSHLFNLNTGDAP